MSSLCRSGQYLTDPTSDPAGSGSDPDPPNSLDIRPDLDPDPVHPYLRRGEAPAEMLDALQIVQRQNFLRPLYNSIPRLSEQ